MPVNPMTGAPNTRTGNVADVAASLDATPTGSSAPSPKDAPRADEGSFGAHVASMPPASAVRNSTSSPVGDRTFTTYNDSMDELLAKMRNILDSRLLSIVVLVLISFSVVAGENFPAFLIVVVVGYMLIDRFITARRAVTLGGLAWFIVLFLGRLFTMGAGRLFIDLDYLFMFCGFLLALAVCGVFFAGRAMYYMGYDRGQALADRAIAAHLVDRLIEHPENVANLDGTFLEVEGAINRVRNRERQVADALRDEARRKDDLVTYLAHDLKTPLASVVGYLSLLEEAPDLPVEQRARFTGIALDKAHRLDALIEEFFDITRFDFHDIVLTRGYVDLALLLAQVADEFYPILTEQGKSVEVEATASLIVLIDGDKMARVFNNVMKNAIAYSYEGSTIRIFAEQTPDSVVVRFENQGDPIPAPKLGMIFEKFYRLDAARATNRGGAGLGLAIAKEIVSAHGGTISCASTPEATVFTIELPNESRG
ncbi:sensor histidine kinase [Collinsella sp. BM28]|uniref:sensor histidine kinase n=1 Tax=Collinsella sp. BM28 TaxID=3378285 RepID=UPI003891C655